MAGKKACLRKICFSPDAVPLDILGAAAVSDFELEAFSNLVPGSVPVLSFPSGEQLQGASTVLRYIARVSKLENFYGSDALSASQVDEWLEYAPRFRNEAEFERACEFADFYLTFRTFLVGYDLSIADVSVWAGLAASLLRWEALAKAGRYPNLVRWYNALNAEHQGFKDVMAKYRSKRALGRPLSDGVSASKKSNVTVASSQKKEQVDGSFDVDLPEAEVGKVCTRFPPEPSGYLHIGHAKAALLNQYFAKKYEGTLIVRFDDTNPSKEKDEFVLSILADLKTLGIVGDKLTYTSDYFPQLLEMAERLIREGKAYVDDTPRDEMKEQRMVGTESKCRNNSVEENLKLWKEMLGGTDKGRECCLRGKLDMQAANKTLRDPVYYRCNPTPHHRVGGKYKVYPTYDFACPFVDSYEGVTHALRSSEYHDRNDQYYRILADMGMRKVHVWDFSRLNFVYTLLSKRKLQMFVDSGRVQGWDDPRFPTVQGIRRRGLTVEALTQFILSQGASKNLNLMEWDKLWTINKKIIDPICPRHTAVYSEGKVLLSLSNGPDASFVRAIPRHKKFAGAGMKATTFTKTVWLDLEDASQVQQGEEVTLMDWGNVIIGTVQKDGMGKITGLTGVLHPEGSVKTTKLKLTWLPDIPDVVSLSLVELDYLITKKKLEETDQLENFLNPRTWWEVPAIGDSNMRNLKKGEILQLERKGYFVCDVPFIRPSRPITLISIPDGRQKPASASAAQIRPAQ